MKGITYKIGEKTDSLNEIQGQYMGIKIKPLDGQNIKNHK